MLGELVHGLGAEATDTELGGLELHRLPKIEDRLSWVCVEQLDVHRHRLENKNIVLLSRA